MAMDWTYGFAWQYSYAKQYLGDLQQFDADWRETVLSLQRLMTDVGFDPNRSQALTRLRSKINSPSKERATADPASNILSAVGISTRTPNTALEYAPKMAAASLKFLQHIYVLENAGSHCVWLLSLPSAMTDWPSMQMHMTVTTTAGALPLLGNGKEHFSDQEKKDLSNAALHALHWVQRANICLASAASASGNDPIGKQNAQEIVRRWFADPNTTQIELDRFINKLCSGFKAMTASLTQGRFILTDWVPLRQATSQEEQSWLATAAFTFCNRGEGLDVVYIEQSFFGPGDVLTGPKFWTAVLVHELSHLVAGTVDVPYGTGARYAFNGIGPHAGFPGRDAIQNAENWAFFCADCAGALTENEKLNALKIA